MISRIGKLSLIFGTFLSILCLAMGLVSELFGWFKDLFVSEYAYYPFFALMPLAAMLLSHLAAWLICFFKARKNSFYSQKMHNSIGVLFKTYFYLWASVAVLIAAGGFIFLSFDVHYLQTVFAVEQSLLSLAWFCVVVVSAMVWAVVGAWKVAKFVGSIVAFLTFLLFAIASVTVGAFYHFNATAHEYRPIHRTQGHEAAIREAQREMPQTPQFPQTQNIVSNEANVSNEEDFDASETDIDRAIRFAKFKFELETEQRPIDLIRHWSYWWSSYKESDFGYSNSSREFFRDPIDFHRSKADFYFLVNSHMKNDHLLSFWIEHNSQRINPREGAFSRNAFVRSGASDCVKILLWAYYDIYSRDDSERILREIYNHMSREPEPHEYSNLPPHYEILRPLMSDKVVDDINRICIRNTDDVEWATASMARWAYSFWARRYNDRVDNTVYRILKIVERMY